MVENSGCARLRDDQFEPTVSENTSVSRPNVRSHARALVEPYIAQVGYLFFRYDHSCVTDALFDPVRKLYQSIVPGKKAQKQYTSITLKYFIIYLFCG